MSTLLGMQMGEATGANLGYQQAQANQMNAQIASQQNMANFFSTTAEAYAGNPGYDPYKNIFTGKPIGG